MFVMLSLFFSQAVSLHQDGGQLWIFGGEFASPTQSQFYHYKDLWVYSLKGKVWQEIRAPGGPSSRSGHRMVCCKKQLIVFGGFHDNIRDYKYFNDVYAFNLDTYAWAKLDTSGFGPSPRSGVIMAALQDQQKILIYGGYSKERIKKDVDKGTVHTDMFMLTPEGKTKNEDEWQPIKWKWSQVKQSGCRPSPRCGMSLATISGNKGLIYGGVFDQEEDDEQIEGVFFNDLFTLDLEKGKWFETVLRGKKSVAVEKKKRRKKKEENEEQDEDFEMEDDDEAENGMEDTHEEMKKLQIDKMETESEESVQNIDKDIKNDVGDSIFTVTVGPQTTSSVIQNQPGAEAMDEETKLFVPSCRFGSLVAVKDNILYLYGGMCEIGDKLLTYADFYSLDVHKYDEWNILIPPDDKMQVYDEDIEELLEGCDVPSIDEEEEFKVYFERTKQFWIEQSQKYFENENMKVSKRTVEKFAKEMCQEYFSVKSK
ncbi:hypothetical protein KUTeg_019324 [Tegillarca granosa]|uniref:Kelch domain-containing protein 4 n=1 Tax=Tegillarca granosa TaxID=220873 RepID=A0ABQ9EC70_TEGGR|nr:hypothetical protein KUTeg_019324 [Tegillarca granosa]